jgi:hypothetical protein
LLLLLWLRLWDDLRSIEKDRKAVPNRITVNPDNTLILWKWLFAISLMSLLLIYELFGLSVLTISLVLAIFLLLVYALREKLNRLTFDLLVLLKYPAIALIASSESTRSRDKILPLITIYLILLVYEVFHDREHLSDRDYFKAGFVAWLSLLIGFASHIVLDKEGGQFEYAEWSLLSLCVALFLLAMKYERIRTFQVMRFVNGLIYLGFLAIPG